MSVFGLSSYFLWTQKGATVLPLVRGSGFVVKFDLLNGFYGHHIVTAAHVACPVKFPAIFGNNAGLRAIGERHITTGLLIPDTADSTRNTPVPCAFVQKRFLSVDVASLRVKDEKKVLTSEVGNMIRSGAIEFDLNPISRGEELVIRGVRTHEEKVNASDVDVSLSEESVTGTCHSALQSHSYGTVLLVAGESRPHSSLCGGPVLRKSNGKCVGVLVAAVYNNAPPVLEDEVGGVSHDIKSFVREPWLDISGTKGLETDATRIVAAFAPVTDFHDSLRRSET